MQRSKTKKSASFVDTHAQENPSFTETLYFKKALSPVHWFRGFWAPPYKVGQITGDFVFCGMKSGVDPGFIGLEYNHDFHDCLFNYLLNIHQHAESAKNLPIPVLTKLKEAFDSAKVSKTPLLNYLLAISTLLDEKIKAEQKKQLSNKFMADPVLAEYFTSLLLENPEACLRDRQWQPTKWLIKGDYFTPWFSQRLPLIGDKVTINVQQAKSAKAVDKKAQKVVNVLSAPMDWLAAKISPIQHQWKRAKAAVRDAFKTIAAIGYSLGKSLKNSRNEANANALLEATMSEIINKAWNLDANQQEVILSEYTKGVPKISTATKWVDNFKRFGDISPALQNGSSDDNYLAVQDNSGKWVTESSIYNLSTYLAPFIMTNRDTIGSGGGNKGVVEEFGAIEGFTKVFCIDNDAKPGEPNYVLEEGNLQNDFSFNQPASSDKVFKNFRLLQDGAFSKKMMGIWIFHKLRTGNLPQGFFQSLPKQPQLNIDLAAAIKDGQDKRNEIYQDNPKERIITLDLVNLETFWKNCIEKKSFSENKSIPAAQEITQNIQRALYLFNALKNSQSDIAKSLKAMAIYLRDLREFAKIQEIKKGADLKVFKKYGEIYNQKVYQESSADKTKSGFYQKDMYSPENFDKIPDSHHIGQFYKRYHGNVDKLLAIFKSRIDLSTHELDLLDNLEKLTSSGLSMYSPDGAVKLQYPRIKTEKRLAEWKLLKGNNSNTLEAVFGNEAEAKAASDRINRFLKAYNKDHCFPLLNNSPCKINIRLENAAQLKEIINLFSIDKIIDYTEGKIAKQNNKSNFTYIKEYIESFLKKIAADNDQVASLTDMKDYYHKIAAIKNILINPHNSSAILENDKKLKRLALNLNRLLKFLEIKEDCPATTESQISPKRQGLNNFKIRQNYFDTDAVVSEVQSISENDFISLLKNENQNNNHLFDLLDNYSLKNRVDIFDSDCDNLLQDLALEKCNNFLNYTLNPSRSISLDFKTKSLPELLAILDKKEQEIIVFAEKNNLYKSIDKKYHSQNKRNAELGKKINGFLDEIIELKKRVFKHKLTEEVLKFYFQYFKKVDKNFTQEYMKNQIPPNFLNEFKNFTQAIKKQIDLDFLGEFENFTQTIKNLFIQVMQKQDPDFSLALTDLKVVDPKILNICLSLANALSLKEKVDSALSAPTIINNGTGAKADPLDKNVSSALPAEKSGNALIIKPNFPKSLQKSNFKPVNSKGGNPSARISEVSFFRTNTKPQGKPKKAYSFSIFPPLSVIGNGIKTVAETIQTALKL